MLENARKIGADLALSRPGLPSQTYAYVLAAARMILASARSIRAVDKAPACVPQLRWIFLKTYIDNLTYIKNNSVLIKPFYRLQ